MIAPTYDKRKNKAILYFSASSPGDYKSLDDFGITEILVSYHYIRKNLKFYEKAFNELHAKGGILMTDSGAFSFMGSIKKDPKKIEEAQHEEFWISYLTEYVAWIRSHKDIIFSAVNFDIDKIVGRDVVRKWNKQYFEPLEKEGIQIIYVAHEDDDDKDALGHFSEYCYKYKYVGINQVHKDCAAKFYTIAKLYNVRVHGFAWTEFSLLKSYPFFSADSVTWLGGARFGTTYKYDGKNFTTIDYKHKYRRKAMRILYEENKVNFYGVTRKENRVEVNRMNLIGWMGFRKEFLKIANLKLTNKCVSYYDRNH